MTTKEQDNKFYSVLQEKVDKIKEQEKEDTELRKKYGIADGKTVGIHIQKDSIPISIFKILVEIVRFIASFFILILATIGLISIIHPSSREILLQIYRETMNQLMTFL